MIALLLAPWMVVAAVAWYALVLQPRRQRERADRALQAQIRAAEEAEAFYLANYRRAKPRNPPAPECPPRAAALQCAPCASPCPCCWPSPA